MPLHIVLQSLPTCCPPVHIILPTDTKHAVSLLHLLQKFCPNVTFSVRSIWTTYRIPSPILTPMLPLPNLIFPRSLIFAYNDMYLSPSLEWKGCTGKDFCLFTVHIMVTGIQEIPSKYFWMTMFHITLRFHKVLKEIWKFYFCFMKMYF